METNKRENWGSRFGFIMAAAGSAVGLGNIWRFPYLTGTNGGGAFILIYLLMVLFVGLTIMLAEFTVGRRSGLAAVGAYRTFSRHFTFAGVMGVITAFFIMGFYPVVGGWAIAYIFKSVTGLLSNPAGIGDAFGAFITNPVQPLLWMGLYLLINIVIVARGVSSGIEMAGKILMPILFVLLILITLRGLMLGGSGEGLRFLFVPDFSAVTGSTWLAGLGQAFFSLSLGMGCMITYGSYLKKEEKLPQNAVIVTALDTSVAMLAGLAIFPALFHYGLEPAQGPGLVFVVVPTIFANMGVIGPILSIIFFVALFVAALTSSVSLLEVVVAFLMDERKMPRKTAVWITGIVMAVLCTLSSLSLGVMSDFTIPGLGVGFFDFFDFTTDKIYMAIGGLLLAVFVGWVMKKEDLLDETTNGGTNEFKLFNVWYFLVKFVVPVAIFVVAWVGITSIAQKGLMIFGLASIAILAIFSRKM